MHPMSTHQKRSAPRRPAMLFAAVLAVALTVAGCSSATSTSTTSTTAASTSAAGSSSSSGDPAGKEQVCQARDELKTSLAALVDPTLLLGGADGITAAVDQVQTDLDALAAAGRQDYAPQVEAMQTALTDVQTAVSALGDGNASANLTAVGTAIADTGTASSALFTQLTAACGT
jgi:hypothetical protein